MDIFNLAALTAAGCLAFRLGSHFIAKHKIEAGLVEISPTTKKRGKILLNLIIVLKKNDLLTDDLNEVLEQAYISTLKLDTWEEIAAADRKVTEAIDLALEALDGQQIEHDAERLQLTKDAFDMVDADLLEFRSSLASRIAKHDASNSTVVSRVMGLPKFGIKLLVPLAADGTPKRPLHIIMRSSRN